VKVEGGAEGERARFGNGLVVPIVDGEPGSSNRCQSADDDDCSARRMARRHRAHGLYGVDLKQVGDRVVVIEVNDNPSIDAGVEDAYLGKDLYRRIMDEFLRRMERKRLGLRG
jgi:hypothetical protein